VPRVVAHGDATEEDCNDPRQARQHSPHIGGCSHRGHEDHLSVSMVVRIAEEICMHACKSGPIEIVICVQHLLGTRRTTMTWAVRPLCELPRN
jgi:hypothetical protein